MRAALLAALIATAGFATQARAHGGRFRGPSGGVPPGLPSQPSKPGQSGGSFHTWLTWWGHNQFKHLDYKNRQAARRGPVTGKRAGETEDPNAWRALVRQRLTPVMIRALEDGDEEVRTAAAVALGKWRVRSASDRLKKMRTADDVKQVRESALLGLILMRDPALRDDLRAIADSGKEDLRMRGYALLGLGMMEDPAARAYLLALLDSGEKKARQVLPTREKKRRELLCAAIAGLTHSVNPDRGGDFLRIAKDEKLLEEVRAFAVAAIGKVGAKLYLPDVMRILRESKIDQMRRSAAIALGVLATRKDADAMQALHHALRTDRDRIVGHFATLSLGQIGGPFAFTMLSESLPKANKESRGFFVIALGLCKEPGAAPTLKRLLVESKDARDRAAAALALGLMEEKLHAPALRDALASAKDWMLMQTSMLSLGILDDKVSAEPIKQALITRKQPAVRTSAALAYALIRQWSAVPVFTDLLRTAKSIVTLSAIAQVMGFLSSEKAVDPLVELYNDKHLQRQARAFALVALGALGDPEPVPILVRLAFDTNYMIRSDPIDEAVTIL